MITGMVTTITDVLNIWNELGVFSYMIPFLLLFAIVFAILEKANVLGNNKAIMSIVAAAVGLLALQFDFVPDFFAVIFPRFGIGISIFFILIIMIGFFFPRDNAKIGWIGWFVGIGVVLWALNDLDRWSSYSGLGGWFNEYFWSLVVLGVLIGVIVWISNPGRKE